MAIHQTHPLDVASQRRFQPGELAGVRSRLHAIARMSPEVREKMSAGLAQKLSAADPSLGALAALRPNPPRRSLDPDTLPAVIDIKLEPPAATQPTP